MAQPALLGTTGATDGTALTGHLGRTELLAKMPRRPGSRRRRSGASSALQAHRAHLVRWVQRAPQASPARTEPIRMAERGASPVTQDLQAQEAYRVCLDAREQRGRLARLPSRPRRQEQRARPDRRGRRELRALRGHQAVPALLQLRVRSGIQARRVPTASLASPETRVFRAREVRPGPATTAHRRGGLAIAGVWALQAQRFQDSAGILTRLESGDWRRPKPAAVPTI